MAGLGAHARALLGRIDSLSRVAARLLDDRLRPHIRTARRTSTISTAAAAAAAAAASLPMSRAPAPPPALATYASLGVDEPPPGAPWATLLWTECERLQHAFSFQPDSARNQFHLLHRLIASRASRLPNPKDAICSVHADYVSGDHANYVRWLRAPGMAEALFPVQAAEGTDEEPRHPLSGPDAWISSLRAAPDDETGLARLLADVALWLLIWGEASNLRYCPEYLCLVFHLALRRDCAPSAPVSDALAAAPFLDVVIRPAYTLLANAAKKPSGQFRQRDHTKIVGYDDWNELFWDAEWLGSLKTKSGQRLLLSQPPHAQFELLAQIDWHKFARKTFYESRTFTHLVVNFARVWALHLGTFITLVPPVIYDGFFPPHLGNAPSPVLGPAPPTETRLFLTGLGGAAVALLLLAVAAIEPCYLPTSRQVVKRATAKVAWSLLFLVANMVLPAAYVVYLLLSRPIEGGLGARSGGGPMRYVFGGGAGRQLVALTQLAISLTTVASTVARPVFPVHGESLNNANPAFTARYPRESVLHGSTLRASRPGSQGTRRASVLLWATILALKLITGYFFLLLPLGEPVRIVLQHACHTPMPTPTAGMAIPAPLALCQIYGWVVTALLVILTYTFFHLDTYMWYTIATAITGFALSVVDGASIFRPWQGVFVRLPDRIRAKILTTTRAFGNAAATAARVPMTHVAVLWNAIVESFYTDHQISRPARTSMLYTRTATELVRPDFFDRQEDASAAVASDAAIQRLRFFGQSLSMRQLPAPLPVKSVPALTVLVPHYAEATLVSLRELVRDGDRGSMLQLAYLQALFPDDWARYVAANGDVEDLEVGDVNGGGAGDMPLQMLGFRAPTNAAVLRTRMWASARTQTLYRTIRGMMQYRTALTMLAQLEDARTADGVVDAWVPVNPEAEIRAVSNSPAAVQLVDEKLTLLVAMQRYAVMTEAERADVDAVRAQFPHCTLRIAYVENVDDRWFACLLVHPNDAEVPGHDRDRAEDATAASHRLYRIELPGAPTLGDGKADNQNTALMFQRGEVLQLIDANQDHYLEEALKVRSVLAEFARGESTLAMVGGREFIFSESIGLLGNVAAGKEYTFGTLTQRVMSYLRSRLFYGHADAFNFTFMATRGGVSKGQRGLHLNEDIYAGMNAQMRGGQIVHTEYMQCGKGRDLGFASILQFTTKIGSGMAEQLIAREHYYLGTQLPWDQLLTFYFAHPGFHLTNVLSLVAIRLFLLVTFLLTWYFPNQVGAACTAPTPSSMCEATNPHDRSIVLDWMRQSLLAFVVYFISYLPFALQLVVEHGLVHALRRLLHQVVSLAPVFETMVTQMYAHALCAGMHAKQAKYAATGRRVATARAPFASLYAQYAHVSIQLGLFLTALLAVAGMQLPSLPPLAFVAFITVSIAIAPFVFNPHQLSRRELARDYAATLRWLLVPSHGWAKEAHRVKRAAMTGMRGQFTVRLRRKLTRVRDSWLLLAALLWPLTAVPLPTPQLAAKALTSSVAHGANLRLPLAVVAVACAPFAVSAAMHVAVAPLVAVLGLARARTDAVGVIARAACVVAVFVSWLAACVLANFDPPTSLLAILATAQVKQAVTMTAYAFFSREPNTDAGAAWWGYGTATFGPVGCLSTVVVRETVAKVLEGWDLGVDFWLVHVLYLGVLVPAAMLPNGDHVHTYHMLLWSCPRNVAPASVGEEMEMGESAAGAVVLPLRMKRVRGSKEERNVEGLNSLLRSDLWSDALIAELPALLPVLMGRLVELSLADALFVWLDLEIEVLEPIIESTVKEMNWLGLAVYHSTRLPSPPSSRMRTILANYAALMDFFDAFPPATAVEWRWALSDALRIGNLGFLAYIFNRRDPAYRIVHHDWVAATSILERIKSAPVFAYFLAHASELEARKSEHPEDHVLVNLFKRMGALVASEDDVARLVLPILDRIHDGARMSPCVPEVMYDMTHRIPSTRLYHKRMHEDSLLLV
ncbi:hypothetical protein GGF31_007312 [Allomyces arbusculus]|nr:hypothetical protein GGF31_007312 [Allomyces arbusculus]